MVALGHPTTCPNCSRKLAVSTAELSAGDPVVCGHCTAIGIYDADGEIRRSTPDDLAELSHAQVHQIACAQHAVRHFIRQRARSN